MEMLLSGTPIEQISGNRDARAVAGRYVAGYADGMILLHQDGHDQVFPEPLERIYARYLSHVGLERSTPEARAYIAGFRDAAADNLPCPPREIELQARAAA
jgi:hypothetical protein